MAEPIRLVSHRIGDVDNVNTRIQRLVAAIEDLHTRQAALSSRTDQAINHIMQQQRQQRAAQEHMQRQLDLLAAEVIRLREGKNLP